MPQVANLFAGPGDPSQFANGNEPSINDLFMAQMSQDPYTNAGMMDPNSQIAQSISNPSSPTNLQAAQGIAGGIGSALNAAGSLYFDVAQRNIQKQQYATNLAALAAQYQAQQTNESVGLGQTEAQGQRVQSQLAGSLAARGLGQSSVKNEETATLQNQLDTAVNSQLRQIALNTTNYNTQVKLLNLQNEANNLSFMSKMFGAGTSGAAGLASIALIALL